MYDSGSFNNLQFNPLNKKKLLEAYPKLSEIISDEWLGQADLDNILRYVIMVYDSRSIIVREEKDLNYRKGIAAELAKLNIEDENYMSEIYSLKNHSCLDIAMRYLMRFSKSKEWAAIVAYESKFWESIKLLLKPIDTDLKDKEVLDAVTKKSAISNEVDSDIRRLDGYYKNFFGDDELESAIKEKGWTPESVAKKFK